MGKIIHNDRTGYSYVSDKGIEYSLYEGTSINGDTRSDIVFIMCDRDSELDDIIGDLDYVYVGWFFGASCMDTEIFRNDAVKVIDGIVNKYEAQHPNVVDYYFKLKTSQEIKEMFSKKILQLNDKAKEELLRALLFADGTTIDWKQAYELALLYMPELIKYRAERR